MSKITGLSLITNHKKNDIEPSSSLNSINLKKNSTSNIFLQAQSMKVLKNDDTLETQAIHDELTIHISGDGRLFYNE